MPKKHDPKKIEREKGVAMSQKKRKKKRETGMFLERKPMP